MELILTKNLLHMHRNKMMEISLIKINVNQLKCANITEYSL